MDENTYILTNVKCIIIIISESVKNVTKKSENRERERERERVY